jgi:hypothetical protein
MEREGEGMSAKVVHEDIHDSTHWDPEDQEPTYQRHKKHHGTHHEIEEREKYDSTQTPFTTAE